MTILTIDTSTEYGTVGLIRDNDILGEIKLNNKISPISERIICSIDYLFEIMNIKLKDIGLISVVIGPGSFTGLRVGLATAKGIAYAKGIPIVGVSSFDCIMAQHTDIKIPVVPIIDAKRNLIYTSIYIDKNPIFPPMALTYEELHSQLINIGEFVVTGPSMNTFKHKLIKDFRAKVMFAHDSFRYISSFTVAESGQTKYNEIGPDNIENIEPTYIRGADVKLGTTII